MELFGILVLIVSFVIFLAIGVPIAYSIGLSATLTLLVSIYPIPAATTVAQRVATGLDSFTLLAIPFFVLAGQLMNKGGIAMKLIDLAKALVGRLPGGLAFVNILSNMLFGAISGSAAASASAIGSFMTPRMIEEGYDRNYSTAVNVTSATTGLSIPPSNVLIVYSLAAGGLSIGALFIAGYIPGILTGLGIAAVAATIAYRRNYPLAEKVTFRYGVIKFLDALPSLGMIIVVIGGILAGLFTATEAAAIAVVYALALSFIYKQISVKDLPNILLRSVITSTIVLLLVGTSIGLSWVMSYQDIPQQVSEGLLALSENKFVILIIINLLLLFVGIFMDLSPAVLIFTPIFLPIVTNIGVDPIHFGIIMILNLSIGLVTPPVGTVLFIGCSISKIGIEKLIRPLLPIYAVMVLILLLVTYLPQLSLWLPGLFGF
ncbi:MAG: TRAP transporter large permease subunit [Bacteroidales bacterium]|nr:TRAP transporter large permease subunit [Bacteroidales bacterium]MBS3775418.1 TRAP transporter large permease subunit [Bacteroidales bacterium]